MFGGPLGVVDDLIMTACSDGLVRAVRILPHRWLGVVGQLDAAAAADCMSCAVDSEQSLLAVSSPDSSMVRFWGVAELMESGNKETEEPNEGKEGNRAGKRVKQDASLTSRQKMPRLEQRSGSLGATSFFADMC